MNRWAYICECVRIEYDSQKFEDVRRAIEGIGANRAEIFCWKGMTTYTSAKQKKKKKKTKV